MSPQPGAAGGCRAAWEEARPSTLITATALSQGLLQGRAGSMAPIALICLGRWAYSPPPAPGVGPWGGGGQPLGSLPPLCFLKFKIHLSQEEGKLLPQKPLALSSKSSLLCRRCLLAPAGPGVTPGMVGPGCMYVYVVPPPPPASCCGCFRGCERAGSPMCPPKAWGQGPFEAPHPH